MNQKIRKTRNPFQRTSNAHQATRWSVICACGDYEHQIHFDYFPKDEKPPEAGEMFVSVCLPDVPFWSRLWNGIRYIFGYKSKYGVFDCIVLSGEKHAGMFREIADTLTEMEREERDLA